MTTVTATKERGIIFNGEMVRAILDGRKTQTRRVVKCPATTNDIRWVMDIETTPRGKDSYTGWVVECDAPLLLPIACPYGKPGDFLYVRETWAKVFKDEPPYDSDSPFDVEYRADTGNRYPGHWPDEFKDDPLCGRWKPSIHMPRKHSRILREIEDVRAERVQDISAKDALKEGIDFTPNAGSYAHGFPDRPKKWDEWSESQQKAYVEKQARPTYISRCNDVERIFKAFRELWDSLNEKRDHGWDKNDWVWVIEFKNVSNSE